MQGSTFEFLHVRIITSDKVIRKKIKNHQKKKKI